MSVSHTRGTRDTRTRESCSAIGEASLVATAQAQHQVQRRLLLDVVVGQRAPVLELLSGENQTLLIRRDAFFVLDLGLDVLNRVRGLDLQRDGLARQRLDEDLRAVWACRGGGAISLPDLKNRRLGRS